jgi:tetrahydromethanopterin S-methyltransferase subunit E
VITSLQFTDHTPVRLVGGQYPFEGRLEVYHNGAWGTVCKTGFDVSTDGVAFCEMLGYNYTKFVYIIFLSICLNFSLNRIVKNHFNSLHCLCRNAF